MTANGKAKFCLGQIVGTPDALEAIEASGQTPAFFLDRHAQCDWGDVCQEDWQANNQALVDGSRILSAYYTLKGVKIWVITDAANDEGHRASTCCLLPENY